MSFCLQIPWELFSIWTCIWRCFYPFIGRGVLHVFRLEQHKIRSYKLLSQKDSKCLNRECFSTRFLDSQLQILSSIVMTYWKFLGHEIWDMRYCLVFHMLINACYRLKCMSSQHMHARDKSLMLLDYYKNKLFSIPEVIT